MDYQTLTEVLGQSKAGATPAPSLNSIIQGIQSQYQPIPSMPVQSGLYGANRYISGSPQFGAIEVMPEYGTLDQLIGPSFIPSEFNRDIYSGIDSQRLSDVISTISNDYGGGYGGDGGTTGGLSIGDSGLASSSNIGTGGVTLGAMALGAMTGLPVGLVANVVGKQNIANAINAQAHAQNVAFNNALVAAQMGLTNSPANAAALASAIDSLSAANPAAQASISAAQAAQGISGTTGGAAAAAASAAAAAAAAAGHSDAAIGAASQAAADAAIGGASASAAAAAAADAANAAAADAADADGGGLSMDASVGESGTTDSSTSTDGSGGGGGGGAKIICTKLHALGLMPTNIYEADQAFGKKLVSESPETYYGYVRWAQHIVDLMDRDDLLGKIAVFCSYHIATPWSLAMAEEMGQPVKASWFGKFLMKRGLQFCKLVGSGNKQTAIA